MTGVLESTEEPEISCAEFQNLVESLSIVTKKDGRQPLILNRSQEEIWHKYLDARENKRRPWFICTKSRRLGVSTLILAINFVDVLTRPFRGAKIVAHDWDGSGYLFGILRTFWRYLDDRWKKERPLLSDTNKRLQWAYPHGSWFSVATANRKGLGSGELIHDLHLSEVAKWPDPPAADAVVSILQCVPLHWDTFVFWESTAFGAHNLFHQYWLAAEAGKTDFEPIFLSWKDFPEYSFPVPAGQKLYLDAREGAFQQEYSISDAQMKWAQETRRTLCHGSWEEFNQEYPVVSELAFKFSGYPWFDASALADARQDLCDPVSTGHFVWGDGGDGSVFFEAETDSPLT